jgi:DNA-binding XRE family transcriptional regulator
MADATPRSPGLQALHRRLIAGDPARIAGYEQALGAALLAHDLRRLREAAGLSRRRLAARAGVSTSTIARLEDPDHQAHRPPTVRRVAAALGYRVRLTLERLPNRQHPPRVA